MSDGVYRRNPFEDMDGIRHVLKVSQERHDMIWSVLQWFMNSNRAFYSVMVVGMVFPIISGRDHSWMSSLLFLGAGLIKANTDEDSTWRRMPLTVVIYEFLLWCMTFGAVASGIGFVSDHSEPHLLDFLGFLNQMATYVCANYLLSDLMSPPRPRKKIRLPKKLLTPAAKPVSL